MSKVAVETCRGTVGRVFFCNPESPAMAGVLRLEDGSTMRFKGRVAAQVGDKLEVTGTWVNDPKWGLQLDVQSGVVRMDESPDGLASLLASDDRFRGLGPVRSKKLVEAALALSPDGTLAAALSNYQPQIAARAGVPLEIVVNASLVWNEKRSYFDALAALVDQGWSGAQAATLVKELGENAAAMVRADPYSLIRKIERFGFRTVDAIARKLGVEQCDQRRLIAGVSFCLDRIGDDGHTWTTREALLAAAMLELRPNTFEAEDSIAQAVEWLIQEGLVHIDTSPVGTEIIADARVARAEFEVFRKLLAGMEEPALGELPAIRFDGPRTKAIAATLNEGQLAALQSFTWFRFVVLTGGAGKGKTYTVRALCDAADESGLSIKCCAPTGKAAKKLSVATKRKAVTIHRLLEPEHDPQSNTFRFTRHERNPLDCDILFVDEISMVDIRLMRSLLSAVRPTTRVVMIGDHNQIPSVSAGAILRDLLSARGRLQNAVNVLTQTVRQAGILARNTSAILDGVVAPRQADSWRIVDIRRDSSSPAGACAMLVEELVSQERPPAPFTSPLDLAWDVQVLAPMKKGPLGTHAINVHIQRLRQRLLGHEPPGETKENEAPKPLPGDKVIWTKNDYDLGLFNGTQGIVTAIKKDGTMHLFTDDGNEVEIPPGKRKSVEVAYALTIHKAQGSEWPLVVAAISSSHHVMRDRNLLYTCVSRASEAVVLFGDADGIRGFARHRRSTSRQTFGSFLVHGWTPRSASAS